MEKQLRIIQLVHPGREHTSRTFPFKHWNTGGHRRKFIVAKGRYADKEDDLHESENIHFWGEWEPPSTMTKINAGGEKAKLPQYVHQCQATRFSDYTNKTDNCRPTNTDPYIFGENFIYSNCLQDKLHQKSSSGVNQNLLKYVLAPGSIILFGSNMKIQNKFQFCIDTVFVVSEGHEYTDSAKDMKNFRTKGIVSDVFYETTLLPLCPSKLNTSCAAPPSFHRVLYKGATYENRVNGMYSFFPCESDTSNGFERPKIESDQYIAQYIAQGNSRGLKGSGKNGEIENWDECKTFWERVKKSVIKNGLKLGVYAEEPAFK